jgi:hypothetical protein
MGYPGPKIFFDMNGFTFALIWYEWVDPHRAANQINPESGKLMSGSGGVRILSAEPFQEFWNPRTLSASAIWSLHGPACTLMWFAMCSATSAAPMQFCPRKCAIRSVRIACSVLSISRKTLVICATSRARAKQSASNCDFRAFVVEACTRASTLSTWSWVWEVCSGAFSA